MHTVERPALEKRPIPVKVCRYLRVQQKKEYNMMKEKVISYKLAGSHDRRGDRAAGKIISETFQKSPQPYSLSSLY